ncbi:Uncharacterised protein [uncultured archaeon]|nr:Uncharacterised protein [uncultured archaeon]
MARSFGKKSKKTKANAKSPDSSQAKLDVGDEGKYKFAIIRNYPESQHYELVKKKRGLVDSMLARLGLKKDM